MKSLRNVYRCIAKNLHIGVTIPMWQCGKAIGNYSVYTGCGVKQAKKASDTLTTLKGARGRVTYYLKVSGLKVQRYNTIVLFYILRIGL